jgi:hypothetical protein
MSIAVELDALREAIGEQAPFAYLLTVTDESTPHLVAVNPSLTDEVLVCSAGKTSVHNAGTRTRVSLVWPPLDSGGYSLIVDGDATTGDETVSIAPTRAVLHRPAPGGGNDCVRL